MKFLALKFKWLALAAFFVSCAFGSARLYSGEPIVFDFESGDFAQTGWIVAEGECTKPLGSRDKTFHFDRPYPKKGKWYLTTLESTAGEHTFESNTCVLESPVFVLTEGAFHLGVGGGDIPETWLELCEMEPDGTTNALRHFHGKTDQTLEEYDLDLSAYIGKPLLFRVVDRGTGAWSYLHLDDLRGTGAVDPEATKIRRERLFAGELQKNKKEVNDQLSVISSQAENFDFPEELTDRFAALTDALSQIDSDPSPASERVAKLNALKDEVAALKRDVFASALLGERLVLYVSRVQYPYEHHNTETTYQTDDICTYLFPGGSSLKLWNPATDETTVLLNVPKGIVRDPCVSFDAKRLLLSIRWEREDDFHLYELDLTNRDLKKEVAREDLRQITFGSGVSDIGPQYLPNGRIIFSSTREPKYCMCNRHIMHNLFTINADGSNLLQIGHSTLFEGDVSLLPDGRALYFRWEYVDRNFSDAEGVWTVNPDGTNHALYWGNNTESPAANLDARIMPDTDGVFVCTMTACHTSPWGAIAIVDRKKGLDDREPVLKIWPPEAIDFIGTHTGYSYDSLLKLPRFFEDPIPIDSENILAVGTIPAADRPQTKNNEPIGVTGIFALTSEDNGATLLHFDPVGCFDPIFLEETDVPPIIPDKTDLSRDSGEFYVVDVYQGFGMDAVPRGEIKYLRVVEAPEKRFWTHPSWWGVDSLGAQQAPAMNWDDFGNKRIVGIVPIEEDGSVYFTAPCDKFLFFQLLDENMEVIQSMRSGVTLRPGETNGCFGCHEDRLEAFPSNANTIAMQKEPQKLQLQFDREPFLFSYTQEIQPIWDKYCVSCHDWPTEKSSEIAKKASDKLLLCGDLNALFNRSYMDIRLKKYVDAIGSAFAPKRPPYSWGARSSKLMKILREGHDNGGSIDQARAKLGVGKVDADSIEMVATWIDMNAPYYPDFSTGFPDNSYGRSPLTNEETNELASLTGFTPINAEYVYGRRPEKPLEQNMSFTRPERSPCLAQWNTSEARKTNEYKRALEILNLGKQRLTERPREDMPGWQLTNPVEIRREAKYEALREKLRRMQDAELKGEKIFDKDDQPEIERCFQ